MTIEKPSRNEDEYFAQQNAELLRKQREKSEASAPRGGAQEPLHEVPQGRLRPGQR